MIKYLPPWLAASTWVSRRDNAGRLYEYSSTVWARGWPVGIRHCALMAVSTGLYSSNVRCNNKYSSTAVLRRTPIILPLSYKHPRTSSAITLREHRVSLGP